MQCPQLEVIQNSVLIVHLGALGAVVRSTALLSEIHRKHSGSSVTWVTDKPADQLLKKHPLIDRVLTTSAEDILQLSALEFDVAYVIDKSLKAVGVAKTAKTHKTIGFKADSKTGAILPANSSARELWELGIDNHKKFFLNQKSEVQLMCEALELSAASTPEYNLPLTVTEEKTCEMRKQQWAFNPKQPIIGINTGCSSVIPAKKLTVQFQRQLLENLISQGYENLVLLGGPEDEERNQKISYGLPVIQSPTGLGLRDGLISVAACDLVVTGDSLGMHMAISQKKYVIAWFGPTCAQEIELYGRGTKVLTKATCSPCWKRTCDKSQMCYDQVDLQEILNGIHQGSRQWQQQSESLSFKPHF